ncbi:MAG TPA: ABC transporter substrate-binding protein [Candidatus Binatia bacterium]|nr:ABC transporter substrate-binding protein [Candidatus Binatia bacterium]
MSVATRIGRLLVCGVLATLIGTAAWPANAADPIEIYAVLPMTGSLAFAGREENEALQLFEAAVNRSGELKGRTIKFVISDDQTNPQTAVLLMTQALAHHPSIVIDGGPATTCRATAALIANGPVEYCLSPAIHPPPGSYQFSSLYSSNDIFGVQMRYLRERGLKKIGVLNGTDASSQDSDNLLAELIKAPDNVAAGVTFVAYEHFNLADLTVRAQLARIKAAGAQALITTTVGTSTATVLHGVQEVGLDVPVLTSAANMSYPQLESYKDFMPKELLFSGPPALIPDQIADRGVKSAVLDYLKIYKTAGAARPGINSFVTWDPLGLMIASLKQRGPDATAAQVRDAIASTRNWPGILGRYDFVKSPQRGLDNNWVIIERWDPDKDAFVAMSKPGGAVR